MIPKNLIFPVFEANQVLTQRHLNDLYLHLDEQNRLTRTNLVGMGIICGLNVTVADDFSSIQISKGVGVTSEGYIITLPDTQSEVLEDAIVLSSFKRYQPPAQLAYPPFRNGSGNIDLWELFPAGEPETTPITQSAVTGKVVLLFAEHHLNDLKNCNPNSCDDKGQQVTVTIRKLLIRHADALHLMSETYVNRSEGEHLINQIGLPSIKIRRLDVVNTGMNNGMEIFDAYRRILLETQSDGSPSLFHRMEKLLQSAWIAYQPAIASLPANDPFAGKLISIQARLTSDYHQQQIVYTQYYYDFLRDLIAAYEEFREKAQKWRSICLPDQHIFPNHLLLGELEGDRLAGLRQCRHYFMPSPAQLEQRELSREVRMLFQRMQLMVDHFELPPLPVRANPARLIRITPSQTDADLSSKAIPYYFKVQQGQPNLIEQWSYSKTNSGRATHNLSYHAHQYSTTDFILQPLSYDVEGNNFYRIEGHIGLSWREAVKHLLASVRRFRLPFDVIALNADQFAVTNNPQPHACMDHDLNVIYKAWLREAHCLFDKKVGFFSSYDLQSGLFTRLAGSRVVSTNRNAGRRAAKGREVTSTIATSSIASLGLNKLGAFAAINIGGSVINTTGTIGEVLKPEIDKTPVDINASTILDKVNDALKDNEKVKTMSADEYRIVVTSPVKLIGKVAELSESIPDESDDIDMARIQGKYDGVKSAADAYLGDLLRLPDNFVFIPPDERKKAIEELKNLLDNCLDKRLDQLAAEIERRKKAAAESIWFSQYVKKHPEIQHQAGVPSGGTFVLVFKETPDTPKPPANPGTVNPNLLGSVVAANIADLLVAASGSNKPGRAEVENLGAKELKDLGLPLNDRIARKLSGVQFDLLSNAFDKAGLTLDFGGLVADGIFEASDDIPISVAPLPRIPEGVVIADFFIPSRTLSDCPPIQFVLPPPKPSFQIELGCSDQAGNAPVLFSPILGEPPFEIKRGTNAGAAFVPFDVLQPIDFPVGVSTVEIRDSQGGVSLPLTIEIHLPMKITLGAPLCNDAGDQYQFTLIVDGGQPPFLIDRKPPLSSTRTGTSHQLVAGPYAAGVRHTIEIKDSSTCPPQMLEMEHTCAPVVPIAREISSSTSFNTTVNIPIGDNISGVNLVITIPEQPAEGVASVNTNRSITFTPHPSISNKTVKFKYRITDAGGQTAESNIQIKVGAQNCMLPCGGQATHARYPLWISRPDDKLMIKSTERAQLTLLNESGRVLLDENLLELFNDIFKRGSEVNKGNYKQKFEQLFTSINAIIDAKVGSNVFSFTPNEKNDISTISIEHFTCYSFSLQVLFAATQASGNMEIMALWHFTSDGVNVEQFLPKSANFKLEKFGIDRIDKCSVPPVTKAAERLKITNIQKRRDELKAVLDPAADPATTHFHWLYEWSEQPLEQHETGNPKFINEANPKVRLIVVDKQGKWDYMEKSLATGVNPVDRRSSATNPRAAARKTASPSTGRTSKKSVSAKKAVKKTVKKAIRSNTSTTKKATPGKKTVGKKGKNK